MSKTSKQPLPPPQTHPGRKRFLAKLNQKRAHAHASSIKLKHAPTNPIRSKLNAKSPTSPKCGFASPLHPPTRKPNFRSFSTGEYVQPREIGIVPMIVNTHGKNST
jgi:hypothetical protein